MKDIRINLAAALLFAVLSSIGVGHATAATARNSEVRYACEPRQNLVVKQSGETAIVQFIDRRYELRRKASSIGEKFVSASAALIIDGNSAVFVAEDRLQLGRCVEAVHLARN